MANHRRGITEAVVLSLISLSGAVGAQTTTKTFIDYVQPTPITCSPLSSATWGAAGVLPRDTCNGIESIKGAAVPPEYYYWDGKILRGKDGQFHLFGSSWPGSKGLKLQQPTTTYFAAEAVPSTLSSIFPNRKKHLSSDAPQTPESANVLVVFGRAQ